eukprot:5562595-Prymnesium_polylepis.1
MPDPRHRSAQGPGRWRIGSDARSPIRDYPAAVRRLALPGCGPAPASARTASRPPATRETPGTARPWHRAVSQQQQ